ncbi:MAG: peptide deformylase [Chloroflexi bacterium]|nr:peptide deformylase [Chloroflexota bacterium]
MAVREILTAEQPVLRQKAKKIRRVDASTQKLIDDMLDSMREAHGLGLAAPQIGVGLRVLVIEMPEDDEEPHSGEQIILVNPEIVKAEGEQFGEEGCLSIPGYVGMVRRAMKVTVKGLNRNGKEVRVKGAELLARALQHEIDHLDGILFTDRLEKPEDLYRVTDEHARVPVFQGGAKQPAREHEPAIT